MWDRKLNKVLLTSRQSKTCTKLTCYWDLSRSSKCYEFSAKQEWYLNYRRRKRLSSYTDNLIHLRCNMPLYKLYTVTTTIWLVSCMQERAHECDCGKQWQDERILVRIGSDQRKLWTRMQNNIQCSVSCWWAEWARFQENLIISRLQDTRLSDKRRGFNRATRWIAFSSKMHVRSTHWKITVETC